MADSTHFNGDTKTTRSQYPLSNTITTNKMAQSITEAPDHIDRGIASIPKSSVGEGQRRNS